MPRYLALVCAALFAAPAVHAQAADSVRHLPAATLREAVAAAPGEQARSLYARMVVDAGTYTVIALRRTADREAEVDDAWLLRDLAAAVARLADYYQRAPSTAGCLAPTPTSTASSPSNCCGRGASPRC